MNLLGLPGSGCDNPEYHLLSTTYCEQFTIQISVSTRKQLQNSVSFALFVTACVGRGVATSLLLQIFELPAQKHNVLESQLVFKW